MMKRKDQLATTNQPEPHNIIDALETDATRFETRCGDGVLVWRRWGSGRPVLLAHGAHGSWLHWIHNINALAEHRTVWTVDLPGYGDSALLPQQDHAGISDVIAAGLRELIPSELPIDIVGFSFGGVVSAYFASFYPELVRRVILVDTGGLDVALGDVKLQRVRGLSQEAQISATRANLNALMIHDPSKIDELALTIQAKGVANGRFDPIPWVIPDKLLQVLPKLSCQLDAIWGECDRPHPNPLAQERVLRRFQPDMQFNIISGVGHWAMYENPTDFNKTVLKLLDRPLRTK